MRSARAQNKQVYAESLEIDKRLKYCFEVKSNFSKGVQQFE